MTESSKQKSEFQRVSDNFFLCWRRGHYNQAVKFTQVTWRENRENAPELIKNLFYNFKFKKFVCTSTEEITEVFHKLYYMCIDEDTNKSYRVSLCCVKESGVMTPDKNGNCGVNVNSINIKAVV
jgi:hypothetical protein